MSIVNEQPPDVLLTYRNKYDLDWDKLSSHLMAREEIAALSDSCKRCFDGNTRRHSELALITGPSGVGKTSLALTLTEQVVRDNGFMIKGKFDQLENTLQAATMQVYNAFTEAFTEYVDLLMDAGEDTVQGVKEALEVGMDITELLVLQDLIPGLDKILAITRPRRPSTGIASTLKGADAEDRLIQIVCSFFRIVCAQGRPIILFLDDVQWANRSSLNLLASLLTSREDASTSPFLLLCTCRMNEVPEDHPLKSTLRDVQDQGVAMTEIQVSNMTLDEVNHVVSGALHLPVAESLPLSDALFQGTEGNLLFLVELVKKLCDEKAFLNDHGVWTWDMDKVNAAIGIGSISRLIEEKYYRLDSNAQELLRIASCLGSAFSVTVLSHTGIGEAEEVEHVLNTPEVQGFVRFDPTKSSSFRFAHDKVQQTIYQLTPMEVLEELHLSIGRKLMRSMSRELVADNVLLIAHQISIGVHLVFDRNEKQDVAELFFQAGQKAALASSFVTAAAFLHLAISLLSRRHWRDQYKLSLQLYNFAAELEFYNGNLRRVDELIDTVLKHAKSVDDTLVSRFTHIYSLGTRDSMQEGMSESLDLLKLLGEKLSRKPGILHIIYGLVRCKQMLRGKTDEYILNLPTMRDRKKETTMRLMLYSMVCAFYVSETHVPLMAFRLIEITLRHGMNGMACIGFACLGMLSAFQGNIDEAGRFCSLALKIYEKYDAREWQARLVFLVHGLVFPLQYPLRDTLSPLYAAHRSSLVLGDIQFSMNCRAHCITVSYLTGSPLPRVLAEARHAHTLCVKYGQRYVESTLAITIQFYLNMMGPSRDHLVLTGEACNEEEALATSKANNPSTYVYLHFIKLHLAVYMNDFAAAKVVWDNLKKLNEKKLATVMIVIIHFLGGLVNATSTARGDIRIARQQLAKLKVFAKHAPCNYLNKVYLVEAELAAQSGMFDHASTNFKLAIQLAGQEGMVQDQALACERAAYAAQRSRRPREAREYMASARSLYLEWGAQAKVDQLDDALQNLLSQQS